MSTETQAQPTPEPETQPEPQRRLAMKLIGWALVLGGVGIMTWIAWMLLATNASTRAAQNDLLDEWLSRGRSEVPVMDGAPTESTGTPGGTVALLSFFRDGTRLLRDDPLVVVEGVTPADLAIGPGRYPGTVLPGQMGNFAVAGHRTTHDAPFAEIDQLQAGDELRVEDANGETWIYRVVEQRIVKPSDTSVISSDPLGSGGAMLTLTTCHPRFSNKQRLVVFAQLQT